VEWSDVLKKKKKERDETSGFFGRWKNEIRAITKKAWMRDAYVIV
jgi:hypothetical protein